MNINPNSTGSLFFKEKVAPLLTTLNKKIFFVVSIIFGCCLVGVWYVRRHYYKAVPLNNNVTIFPPGSTVNKNNKNTPHIGFQKIQDKDEHRFPFENDDEAGNKLLYEKENTESENKQEVKDKKQVELVSSKTEDPIKIEIPVIETPVIETPVSVLEVKDEKLKENVSTTPIINHDIDVWIDPYLLEAMKFEKEQSRNREIKEEKGNDKPVPTEIKIEDQSKKTEGEKEVKKEHNIVINMAPMFEIMEKKKNDEKNLIKMMTQMHVPLITPVTAPQKVQQKTPQTDFDKMLDTFETVWQHATPKTGSAIRDIWDPFMRRTGAKVTQWVPKDKPNEYQLKLDKEWSGELDKKVLAEIPQAYVKMVDLVRLIVKKEMTVTFSEENVDGNYQQRIVFSNKGLCLRTGGRWPAYVETAPNIVVKTVRGQVYCNVSVAILGKSINQDIPISDELLEELPNIFQNIVWS